MENVFLSSFAAGSVQTLIGHPFDTIKTRMQIYNHSYKNSIINIYKKEGLKSYYKGYFTPLIAGCIQNGILFSTEKYSQSYFKNNYLTGFISGSCSSIVLTPAELIKCHIQKETTKVITIKQVLKKIKKKNITLFTGFNSTFIRDSIGMSIYFGSYNNLQNKNNNPLLHGGFAGVLSWIFSYPFDVIKTKKQMTNNSYSYIINNIHPKQYLRGIEIVLIRSFLVNAGIFYTYENLLKIF